MTRTKVDFFSAVDFKKRKNHFKKNDPLGFHLGSTWILLGFYLDSVDASSCVDSCSDVGAPASSPASCMGSSGRSERQKPWRNHGKTLVGWISHVTSIPSYPSHPSHPSIHPSGNFLYPVWWLDYGCSNESNEWV